MADRTPYGRRRKASPSVVPERTVAEDADRDPDDPPPHVTTGPEPGDPTTHDEEESDHGKA